MTSENSLSAPESHETDSPGHPGTLDPPPVTDGDADRAQQAVTGDALTRLADAFNRRRLG